MTKPNEKVLRKVVILLLSLAAASVVAAILYATLFGAGTANKISNQQDTSVVKADKRDEALALVKDCVTPGGMCYERSQKQLRAAIGSINEYGLALTACADAPGQQTEKELRACASQAVSRAARSRHP